jgi:hypothetical protein
MPVVCSQVQIKDRRFIQAVVVSIVKGGTNKVPVSCHQGPQGVAIPWAMWKEPEIEVAFSK